MEEDTPTFMKLNQNNKCRETLVIKKIEKKSAQINQSTLIAMKIINQKGTSNFMCM